MRQWLHNFDRAIQAQLRQEDVADERAWVFKIVGIMVTAGIALYAQLYLFA